MWGPPHNIHQYVRVCLYADKGAENHSMVAQTAPRPCCTEDMIFACETKKKVERKKKWTPTAADITHYDVCKPLRMFTEETDENELFDAIENRIKERRHEEEQQQQKNREERNCRPIASQCTRVRTGSLHWTLTHNITVCCSEAEDADIDSN